jgi:hypothetical protein
MDLRRWCTCSVHQCNAVLPVGGDRGGACVVDQCNPVFRVQYDVDMFSGTYTQSPPRRTKQLDQLSPPRRARSDLFVDSSKRPTTNVQHHPLRQLSTRYHWDPGPQPRDGSPYDKPSARQYSRYEKIFSYIYVLGTTLNLGAIKKNYHSAEVVS